MPRRSKPRNCGGWYRLIDFSLLYEHTFHVPRMYVYFESREVNCLGTSIQLSLVQAVISCCSMLRFKINPTAVNHTGQTGQTELQYIPTAPALIIIYDIRYVHTAEIVSAFSESQRTATGSQLSFSPCSLVASKHLCKPRFARGWSEFTCITADKYLRKRSKNLMRGHIMSQVVSTGAWTCVEACTSMETIGSDHKTGVILVISLAFSQDLCYLWSDNEGWYTPSNQGIWGSVMWCTYLKCAYDVMHRVDQYKIQIDGFNYQEFTHLSWLVTFCVHSTMQLARVSGLDVQQLRWKTCAKDKIEVKA